MKTFPKESVFSKIEFKYENKNMEITIQDWDVFFSQFFGVKSKKEMCEVYGKSGVYCIDGVYIGRSKNIKDRLKKHICSSINSKHTNKKLQYHIQQKIINNETIALIILSNKCSDETKIIKEMNQKIKLFNKTK